MVCAHAVRSRLKNLLICRAYKRLVLFFCVLNASQFLAHPYTHALFSFTVLPKLNSLCGTVFYMVELCNDAINYTENLRAQVYSYSESVCVVN